MINFLAMDIDGTITDGKIYMGQDGELMKAFSVKDGYAINHILMSVNIVPIVITARNSSIVENRCKELGITEIYQGVSDKLAKLTEVIGADNLGRCAYFGDDIPDLFCMNAIKNAGGIVACPSDAVSEIKAIADYVCLNNAGNGALREFAEWIVNNESDNDMADAISKAIDYLKNLSIEDLVIGQKYIVDNKFFYTLQSYYTKNAYECKLESHRDYVDIQLMLEGEEYMDICDTSRLVIKEEYDSNRDIMFWNIPRHMMRLSLSSGDVVVLYPENAHRGTIMTDEQKHVLKIVGKVKTR